MKSNRWRAAVRGLIGLAIGAVFLWLSLRQTSLDQVQTILIEANPGHLGLALLAYWIDLGFRVARWRILLWEIKPLSFRSVSLGLIVGYAANNLLPARLGELFRADFAGRRYRLSRSAVIASIFVERVLDGLVLVLCLVLGSLFIPGHPILERLTILSALMFLGIFGLLWLINRGFLAAQIQAVPAIANRWQSFRAGLGIMRGQGALKVIGLSLIIWLLEGTAIWLVLQAVGVSLNGLQMLPIVGITSLSTLIPSAPGFVGTYQYAYAVGLQLFSYGSALGIAAATAVQLFLLGSVTITGLILYTSLSILDTQRFKS
ncbi:MAG: lysylphosphatidylglycerol synthase transmembrane domain-containing protein [Thainema sp.]